MLPHRRQAKVGSACVYTVMIDENDRICERKGIILADIFWSQPFSYSVTEFLMLSSSDALVWALNVLSANRMSRSRGDSCMIVLLRARPHGESSSTAWTSTNKLVMGSMPVLDSWYLRWRHVYKSMACAIQRARRT